MESPLAAMLDPWLMRNETIDWASPRTRGLASIRDLRYVGPRPELHEATMIHWDPVMHVFRYNDNEMCPTVEEFQAYLQGFANSNVLAIPPIQENMSHLLRMKLNISEELAASIIHDGELDVPRLIELYGPNEILENHVEQTHLRFAFSICALAAYMLVPANGKVCPSIVRIASQMGVRKNIIPIVLAETLMGLDLFKSRESNVFSGSPRLLQVWLFDKVGLLEAPQANWDHFPRRMLKRSMLYPEQDMLGWYVILHDIQSNDYVWICPWLNMPEMAINSTGFERVLFASLASFTFYIPGRILRQLGITQGLQRAGIEDFQLPDFNSPTLRDYQRYWRNGVLEGPSPDFVDWLDSRYVAWLRVEIKARPGGYY
ncbi:hypothetical protein RHMOL_Rhmol09G0106100 [Rhododendron molle]|uniref:Uncharacterized protein n=1 Tax=Rhododendron molle TaxID=49168 RepID=A0ACC0MD13_RHOML|nr:hypothetical protein RHMOL_Rhmol09G0106100 [Rhododendron molle]